MPHFSFSEEEVNSFVNEITKQLVPVLLEELKQNQLPPVLTRKQFMELADIGDTKCNELFHREDFYPMTRELGHPRVITELFFQWLHENTQREKEVNLKYPYRAI